LCCTIVKESVVSGTGVVVDRLSDIATSPAFPVFLLVRYLARSILRRRDD
jgi:hypothetical protein